MQRRIALARPQDQVLGMFFECTLKGFRELFGPTVEKAAREAEVYQRKRNGFFKYPAAELLSLMDAGGNSAAHRFTVSYPQSLERLGAFLGKMLLESTLGKTYKLRINGDPHQGLAEALSTARSFCTFGERCYERLGPCGARLTFRNELMGPAWAQGLYGQVLHDMTGISMTLRVESSEPPGMNFRLLCAW